MRRASTAHQRRAVAVLCLLAMAAGCSDGRPARVPVSGTVLIDGEPVAQGNIMFVPEGGRPAYGKIEDGSFTLSCFGKNDGALVGENRVAVSSKKVITVNNVEWYTPRHYASHKTSGLTVTVSEPIDDLVLELSSKVDKPRRR